MRKQTYQAESSKAKQAFEDYWEMGENRSLKGLAYQYEKAAEERKVEDAREMFKRQKEGLSLGQYSEKLYQPPRPFAKLESIVLWSANFNWQERIKQRTKEISDASIQNTIQLRQQRAESRFKIGQTLTDLGLLIMQKSEVRNLSRDEARKLLPLAADLVKVGINIQKGESTDDNIMIVPPKPLAAMTSEELREYHAQLVQKTNKSA